MDASASAIVHSVPRLGYAAPHSTWLRNACESPVAAPRSTRRRPRSCRRARNCRPRTSLAGPLLGHALVSTHRPALRRLRGLFASTIVTTVIVVDAHSGQLGRRISTSVKKDLGGTTSALPGAPRRRLRGASRCPAEGIESLPMRSHRFRVVAARSDPAIVADRGRAPAFDAGARPTTGTLRADRAVVVTARSGRRGRRARRGGRQWPAAVQCDESWGSVLSDRWDVNPGAGQLT